VSRTEAQPPLSPHRWRMMSWSAPGSLAGGRSEITTGEGTRDTVVGQQARDLENDAKTEKSEHRHQSAMTAAGLHPRNRTSCEPEIDPANHCGFVVPGRTGAELPLAPRYLTPVRSRPFRRRTARSRSDGGPVFDQNLSEAPDVRRDSVEKASKQRAESLPWHPNQPPRQSRRPLPAR
jgi:hypothetical protein